MGLSVVMLTHNSERYLRESLDSVTWADEIIAVDGGSTDGTHRILAEYGAVVQPQPFDLVRAHGDNFDVARNAGFTAARNPWILVLDSDEVISAALREEIHAAMRASRDVAYCIPRTNLFWGRPVRLLGEDFQLRLFPKGCARYEGSYLDERPVVTCTVQHLAQPLLHYQADSLGRLLLKLHHRTSQRARVLLAAPDAPRQSPWSLFYHLFRYYYRQQGAAEDGFLGLVVSVVYAAYRPVTELKLRWLEARQRIGRRRAAQS